MASAWLLKICKLEGTASLHSFSSQKHIFPLPPPSDMQTWSTMNMLMSTSSVQERTTFQSAVNDCKCKKPTLNLLAHYLFISQKFYRYNLDINNNIICQTKQKYKVWPIKRMKINLSNSKLKDLRRTFVNYHLIL